MSRFVRQHLDPASQLSEILFGLIMVLTVTLTAGLSVAEGKTGVRQLLIATVGCNLAWGIIDGVMYVMNNITLRSLRSRFVHTVQHARDKQTALELIKNEIEARLSLPSPLDPQDSHMLSQSLHQRVGELRLPKVKIEKEDIYGAIACFWLVTISCLSAALPFFIFSEPTVALRVSNALLIILLYLVGRRWAHYAGTNRLITGLSMVAIGLMLVGISILLGG
jgi:hypothetical protein